MSDLILDKFDKNVDHSNFEDLVSNQLEEELPIFYKSGCRGIKFLVNPKCRGDTNRCISAGSWSLD